MTRFTISIPGDSHAVQLLLALKGAPLSCLHALRIAHPKPLEREQLSLMTGWKKDVVTRAMTLLCDVYGLAARISRYAGWILTDKAQLLLPGIETPPRALPEGDLIALGSHVCMNDDEQSPSAGRSIIHALEGDNIALPNPESYTQVKSILEAAGIQGPNLDKLAKVVRPEIAAKWQDWLARCNKSVWRAPEGFCFRSLSKNSEALPPPLAPKSKKRKLRPSITGKLARRVGND